MIEPLFKKRIIYKSLCVYVYVAICEGYVNRGGIIFLLQISKKLLISFNLKERVFKTLTGNGLDSVFCYHACGLDKKSCFPLLQSTDGSNSDFNLPVLSGWLEYLIPADLLVCFVVHVMAIARWRRMKEIIEGIYHGVVIIYHRISTG